jgi:CheY-like chemotaxis protein
MPVMNGWEFIEVFEKDYSSKQFGSLIMLTSSIDPNDEEKAAEYQTINDFITKPLSLEKIERIKEIISN